MKQGHLNGTGLCLPPAWQVVVVSGKARRLIIAVVGAIEAVAPCVRSNGPLQTHAANGHAHKMLRLVQILVNYIRLAAGIVTVTITT